MQCGQYKYVHNSESAPVPIIHVHYLQHMYMYITGMATYMYMYITGMATYMYM